MPAYDFYTMSLNVTKFEIQSEFETVSSEHRCQILLRQRLRAIEALVLGQIIIYAELLYIVHSLHTILCMLSTKTFIEMFKFTELKCHCETVTVHCRHPEHSNKQLN